MVRKVRKILGVFEVFLGIFKKSKEKKDRDENFFIRVGLVMRDCKGVVKNCGKGGVSFCLRLSAFARVCLRLRFRLCGCQRLSAFVFVCLHYLVGPFRGAVFHHDGVPENSPFALMGPFSDLNGPVSQKCLNGPFSPPKNPLENTPLRKGH